MRLTVRSVLVLGFLAIGISARAQSPDLYSFDLAKVPDYVTKAIEKQKTEEARKERNALRKDILNYEIHLEDEQKESGLGCQQRLESHVANYKQYRAKAVEDMTELHGLQVQFVDQLLKLISEAKDAQGSYSQALMNDHEMVRTLAKRFRGNDEAGPVVAVRDSLNKAHGEYLKYTLAPKAISDNSLKIKAVMAAKELEDLLRLDRLDSPVLQVGKGSEPSVSYCTGRLKSKTLLPGQDKSQGEKYYVIYESCVEKSITGKFIAGATPLEAVAVRYGSSDIVARSESDYVLGKVSPCIQLEAAKRALKEKQ